MTPEAPASQPEQVAAFFQKHRTGLVTLVFTDLVHSTALLQQLGDQAGTTFLRQRRQVIRDVMRAFAQAEEIETAGDSFLLAFAKPSDAVRFALLTQARLRAFSAEPGLPVQERIGIHLGEVVISQRETEAKAKDLYGLQLAICARVMSLAQGGQVLLTRGAFDSARQVLKGEDLAGVGPLSWASHGEYLLKGIEEAVEVCEVAEAGQRAPLAPKTSEKAQRQVRADEEPVLGWRPALGQAVPHSQWVLERKLGEGGFGEVWLGRHLAMKERRVFKFCFRADRVRSLKREMTLFRLIKDRIGDHPNIVSLREVYFEEPPFYIEMDYVDGQDLRTWIEERQERGEYGGSGNKGVPPEVKLEIVAQVADALQAAHDAGVIHRDVKPGNILISDSRFPIPDPKSESTPGSGTPEGPTAPSGQSAGDAGQSLFANPKSQVTAKLSDFGIGHVASEEALQGVTRAGFTVTLLGSESASQTGTQLYMAPELLAGRRASTRSDIYSLGVVLYQLLVEDFRRPVTTDWADAIPDPLLRDDLKHCFAGNPTDRFAGAAQFAQRLRSLPQRKAAVAKEQSEAAARERAAYRAGMWRTGAIAAVILAIMVVLVLVSIDQAREARTQARRAEQNAVEEKRQHQLAEEREAALQESVYAMEMNLAYRAWETGDLARALAWLRRQVPEPGQRDRRGFDWRLLRRLCQDETLFTFRGHPGFTKPVVLSSDGVTAATAGDDRIIQLWHLPTYRSVARLTGHKLGIYALAFSPDGNILASGSGALFPVREPGELKLWDVEAHREIASLEGHKLWFYSLAFSPDGRLLASANEDGTVKLWDVAAHTERRTLLGHQGSVFCVGFSPDGQSLATGGLDGTVRLWDVRTAGEGEVFIQQSVPVPSLAFSKDGQILAICAGEKVQLWDRMQRRLRATIPAYEPSAVVAVAPDGDTLAFGSIRAIKLWSLSRMEELGMLRGLPGVPMSLSFAPDSQTLAVKTDINEPTLWRTKPKPREEVLRGHRDNVNSVAISPDGKLLATGTGDYGQPVRQSEVKLWDIVARRELETLPIDAGTIYSLAFSPNGKMLAWGSEDHTVKLWDIASRPRRLLRVLQGHSRGVLGVAFSPDGKTLASSGGNDLTACLWDVDTGQLKQILRGHTGLIRGIGFARDGRSVITCSAAGDSTVRVWEAASGQNTHTWKTGPNMGLAVSADGSRLAVIVWQDIHVYETESWDEVGVLSGHQHIVNSLAFAPSGDILVSGALDASMRLWHLGAMREIVSLRGHGDAVNGVAFSLDQRTLASVGADKTVRLWTAPTFEEIDHAEEQAQNSAARPERIPPRDPRTKANLIDLSNQYNAAFAEDWHGGAPEGDNNLSDLPAGVGTYGGVEFDARGIVQLRFQNQVERFPEAVRNIKIGAGCLRIHFLHSAGRGFGPAGTLIGRFVVHYVNGQTRGIPIRLGDDVWDWHFDPKDPKPTKNSVVAWTGTNPTSRRAGNRIQLFKTSWANPTPEVEISTVDYVSTLTGAGPFLLGITVEPRAEP